MILSPRETKLVLRTLLRPSDSIRPMDVRFCSVVRAQLSNPLRVLSKTQPGWMKLWAIGDWLLDMGGIVAIRAFTLYTLHSTPYALH